MRTRFLFLAVALLPANLLWSQQVAAPSQTARQALIEMLFSKTPGTFVKHLPNPTRATLEKTGALARLQEYSLMASQLQTQGQNLQTFETGSVLLSAQDAKTGQKVEITVDNDVQRGEQDDLDLSFQTYKNGQVQRTPFLPQMTFSMKKEDQTWKLNEISVTVHLPLADPDLLKALTEKIQPQANSNVPPISHTEMTTPPAGADPQVIPAMRMILSAEATYLSRYPDTGYACTLANLDGFGGGEPNERQAMLLSSGLASGRKYGYVFTISECRAVPATRFLLTAVPSGIGSGRRTFCADQSGAIRWSDDGSPATCVASGTPVP